MTAICDRCVTHITFTEKIAEELKFLDMPNVKILFRHEKGKLTANGMDVMELRFISGERDGIISEYSARSLMTESMLSKLL